jgi:hypothetical protein
MGEARGAKSGGVDAVLGTLGQKRHKQKHVAVATKKIIWPPCAGAHASMRGSGSDLRANPRHNACF